MEKQYVQGGIPQPRWQRIILLIVLGYEAAGCLLGGALLVGAPDGRYMDMPVSLMNGVFRDFLIPGIILFGLGVLNLLGFMAVIRRKSSDWFMAGLALGGLFIWFVVEIIILRELHWLHAMWGLPVLLGWAMNIPLIVLRHDPVMMRKALLTCGILSSLLYILTDIIASAVWGNYHFTSQTVSELFAIGAPTKIFVVICFIFYALLIYAFGAGVWLSAQGKRSLKVAAVLIVGKEILGLTGTLFFPLHLRGVEGNYSDIMHGIVTAAGVFLFMFPAMIAGAIAFKGIFRIYSIATMLLFVVFGVLTGFMQPQMSANLPTPMMGICERINIYGYMVWVIVFAIVLMRRENMRDSV